MDKEQDLTVAEVADLLRTSRQTICNLLKQNAFPNAYRLIRDWRIPRADVEALKKHGKAAS